MFRLARFAGLFLLFPLAGFALDGRYATTLIRLCDALVATQITDENNPDYGALVCPSTNPDVHPLHSRAGEAVYPLCIAFQTTRDTRYRDAAVRLGNWMIKKQQAGGAWGEDWPSYAGWTGTTSDQLISLAGAYRLLRSDLTDNEREAWSHSIHRAADYVAQKFPMGNINYQPTGAVSLRFAALAVEDPAPGWLAKADALMDLTLKSINADGFIVGEGDGVDLGYNLAQSIGYIALYGILTENREILQRAGEVLAVHDQFVYPNGSVDNSWGTRSFKWDLESGTKTAPGVYFTFGLLSGQDSRFDATGRLCLDYLVDHSIDAEGRVTYGPHAERHDSSNPPCNYPTFARAQSLALAVAYAPEHVLDNATLRAPAQTTGWHRYFPTVKVALVRTAKIMATVSAYGEISRYRRELVSRGGSLTQLWLDGFGEDGFAQVSSVTAYRREEADHMPNEKNLLPLTPRIECTIDDVYYTNLYETDGAITVTEEPAFVRVSTTGQLRAANGHGSQIGYTLEHRFYSDHLEKEIRLTALEPRTIRIVEPFVKDVGTTFDVAGPNQFSIRTHAGDWSFLAASESGPYRLSGGAEAPRYWCPFPAIECYPIVIEADVSPTAPRVVKLSLTPGASRRL